jgi:DNA end-binding protein Ku
MHNREYTVILRPHKGGLMLHTMFYNPKFAELKDFGRPVELREAEVKMAHQLISALANKFEPEKYYDTFEENVKKLIEAHLEPKEVTLVEKPNQPAPVVDLMSALKESLPRMEKKRLAVSQARHVQGTSKIHAGGGKRVGTSKAA